MFRPVSRKGQRRPFNPDDEWAGLTGHLSLALSLFHSFLGFFWNLAPFFSLLFGNLPLPTTHPDMPVSFDGEADPIQVTDLLTPAAGKNTSNSERRQVTP